LIPFISGGIIAAHESDHSADSALAQQNNAYHAQQNDVMAIIQQLAAWSSARMN
jgi:hypothetical protein